MEEKKKEKKGRVICLFSHTRDQENTGYGETPFSFYPSSPLCIQIHFSSIKFSQETALSSPLSLGLPVSQ